MATDGVVRDDNLFSNPILVSVFDPGTGTFAGPFNTFPGIAPDPVASHDPALAVDPVTGTLFLTFTQSSGTGQAEGFLTRSLNGGGKWKKPVSITGPGTNDFLTPVVAPNGTLYLTWTDFGGSTSTTNDIRLVKSTDGGLTFSHPFTIANNVLKSGSPALCGVTERLTYLDRLVTADAPRAVVDPFDSNRVFVTLTGQGSADPSDVFFLSSNDGGRTWSDPAALPTGPGTQMFPDMRVTPDGRVAVTYYRAESTASVTYDALFSSTASDTVFLFDDLFAAFPLPDDPFPAWNTYTPYDTHYNACFGMQGNAFAAPGSGFYMAWADGGDPGPFGNGGVDPNIDFARFDGAFPPSKARSTS